MKMNEAKDLLKGGTDIDAEAIAAMSQTQKAKLKQFAAGLPDDAGKLLADAPDIVAPDDAALDEAKAKASAAAKKAAGEPVVSFEFTDAEAYVAAVNTKPHDGKRIATKVKVNIEVHPDFVKGGEHAAKAAAASVSETSEYDLTVRCPYADQLWKLGVEGNKKRVEFTAHPTGKKAVVKFRRADQNPVLTLTLAGDLTPEVVHQLIDWSHRTLAISAVPVQLDLVDDDGGDS